MSIVTISRTSPFLNWLAAKKSIQSRLDEAEAERQKGHTEAYRLKTDAASVQDEGLKQVVLAEAIRRGEKAIQAHDNRANAMAAKANKELTDLVPRGMTDSTNGIACHVDTEAEDLRIQTFFRGTVTGELHITPEQGAALYGWLKQTLELEP